MERLTAIWQELTAKYTNNTSLADKLWEKIEANYSAENRHYHNLSHLDYMADQAMRYQNNLSDLDTILLSIFYHDIIYNVIRKDNEIKSADIAREQLSQLGVPTDKIAKCHTQILATQKHALSSNADTNYLLDFDLAILGERPSDYEEYTRKIRKEYAVYPDFLYRRGRKKVLQHFLAMNRIFKTDAFYERYEQTARDNLKIELLTY
jgi:predicted metal-dependent HD superfamily phosphohydrolase